MLLKTHFRDWKGTIRDMDRKARPGRDGDGTEWGVLCFHVTGFGAIENGMPGRDTRIPRSGIQVPGPLLLDSGQLSFVFRTTCFGHNSWRMKCSSKSELT